MATANLGYPRNPIIHEGLDIIKMLSTNNSDPLALVNKCIEENKPLFHDLIERFAKYSIRSNQPNVKVGSVLKNKILIIKSQLLSKKQPSKQRMTYFHQKLHELSVYINQINFGTKYFDPTLAM